MGELECGEESGVKVGGFAVGFPTLLGVHLVAMHGRIIAWGGLGGMAYFGVGRDLYLTGENPCYRLCLEVREMAKKRDDITRLADLMVSHITADGPVSWAGIEAEVKRQYVGHATTDRWHLTTLLNAKMRAGIIELYDDGESFVTR
jgi:hypothetical protein